MSAYKVPCIYGQIKSDYSHENRMIEVTVPGSKSITNRALLIAALAKGDSELNGILLSDDSRVFIECLRSLGINATVNAATHLALIRGTGGSLPSYGSINVGSAGTAARFITAALALSQGSYEIDSSEQMKKRPMDSLIEALSREGAVFEFREDINHFPFKVSGNGFSGREININIDKSSQFLSALLINSVMSSSDVIINVTGSHGMSYIDMTVNMMKAFGVNAIKENITPEALRYRISSGQGYKGMIYDIEPDLSAAAYFYALSPLLGICVCVKGTAFDSLQGDVGFLRVLEQMGCRLAQSPEGLVLYPPNDGIMHGIDVDMSAFSDQAITLAAIAPYADSPVTIRGIGHISLQESDRMSAIINELNRAGIKTGRTEDSITVYPGTPKPCLIETYDDHRMAMGFTLMGLRSTGISIDNPGCVSKTFENYYEVLEPVISEIIE